MKIVGTMFIEVNQPDYHGVVEVAMVELPSGEVQPGGIRDADLLGDPERTPELDTVREAIEMAKWCYLNQAVFEGKTSNVSVAKWEQAVDTCVNDVLREMNEDDPELN